jgi:hypothetical protein
MSVTITSIASPGRSAGRPVASKPVEDGPKWSARRTLAFVVAVCGAFWLSVAAGIAWLVQALAG